MRLLILTQAIDAEDRELGFFIEWVRAFSERFSQVTIIALRVGTYDLPANVRVVSLGKANRYEREFLMSHAVARVRYLYQLFGYVWRFRNEYDAVYIHQNEEYAIVSGWLWRLLGKKVSLWRNHYAGSWRTHFAVWSCHIVFCTSRHSYTARFNKTVLMPVGVPDRLFFPGGARRPQSVLSLGRITPSKKIDLLLDALAELRRAGTMFSATIAGGVRPEDEVYLEHLRVRAQLLGIEAQVSFVTGVPYAAVREIFASHEIFVNMSASGMFDKTMFEAMLCETLVAVCSKDLRTEVDGRYWFAEGDALGLARVLTGLLALSPGERDDAGATLRRYALDHHSLSHLAARLSEELTRVV